jgi:hypothetical protein
MPKWIPCGSGFIEADVIRWKEDVWRRPKRKQGHAVNLGDRMVTAEVIRDEEGWVDLLIRAHTISHEKPGRKIEEVLAKGTEIRRRRSTIEGGKPERLIWSDESARTIIASSFLGGEDNSF